MTGWTDLFFILVLVLDLFVLASSRLRAGIRAVAVQGGVLALLPVLLAGDATETRHVAVLGIGALVVKLALGAHFPDPVAAFVAFGMGQLAFAVAIGLVESTMARSRLARVPQLLIGASVLSGFALVLLLR